MKIDFSNMDIGGFPFNFVRTLMVAPTGGADVNECFKVAANIKDNDLESWVKEWATLAENVLQTAEEGLQSSDMEMARKGYLRASNYYRSAVSSLSPMDKRFDPYLRLSRESFHKAAKLCSPTIKVLDIPFEKAHLPAYFLSSGQPKQPTLLVINGGDSSNEEMVHWVGFEALKRGWNCLIFEGPGQWSALQLNPGMYLRPDYEVPVKAVIDYLLQRPEVDPQRIALIGYSLSSQLAARVAAFEKRICACICVGGIVVDVNEAWEAVMPSALRNALPGLFDTVFTTLERISPQLRSFANHYTWSFGVHKPHELLEAWRPFNITGLAPKIECPMLVMAGEGEYEQTDKHTALSMLNFMCELSVPVSFHEFAYKEGWVASHCSVGDEAPANSVIFDWLDRTVNGKADGTIILQDWTLLNKYHSEREILELQKRLRIIAA